MGDGFSGRDLRKYARNTTIQLFAGGILLVLVVGNLLIWWLYGPGAVRMSLLCMLVFVVPVLLAFGGLAVMDWIVKRNLDE
ncbi:MAG: hypothetical protein P1P76_09625 [Anaerolineales bacterium]|nr:hypothetical protein [Anaerolineales bacterium]